MDLNQFAKWQSEGKDRSVTIELTKNVEKGCKIWAYDYKLQIGQHVQSVDEIDLEGQKEREEKGKYIALRKKYGENNG